MNFSIDRKGILPSQLTNRNGMFNNISAIQHNNIQRNFNKHINNKNSSQNRNIQEVSNNNNNNIIPIISNKHESIDIKILYIFTSLYTLAIAKRFSKYFSEKGIICKIVNRQIDNNHIIECENDPTLYFFIITPTAIIPEVNNKTTQSIRTLPYKKYILYQTEQYNQPNIRHIDEAIISRAYAIFDYSNVNLAYYNDNIKERVILISPFIDELPKNISTIDRPIDILFIGTLNERRNKIIRVIKHWATTNGNNYTVRVITNKFGKELDSIIQQSKIVLNLHYYPNAILEVFRIHDLLGYDCRIISELPQIPEEADLIQRYTPIVDFVPVVDDALRNIKSLLVRIITQLQDNNWTKCISGIKKSEFIDTLNRETSTGLISQIRILDPLFYKYYLGLENPYNKITYDIIKNNIDNELYRERKKFAHLHCYDISKFRDFYETHLERIKEHFSIIVTYSIGDNQQNGSISNNILFQDFTVLKIPNRGLDIGAKFCAMEWLNVENIDYEYILFLHSKRDFATREKYFKSLIDNLESIFDNDGEMVDGYFPDIQWRIDDNKMKTISGNPEYQNMILPERNTLYRTALLQYLNIYDRKTDETQEDIFIEGNCYILSKKVANKLFSDPILYNILNTETSFDYNWVCFAYNISGSIEKVFEEFKTRELVSRNKLSYDAYIEHAFERVVLNCCDSYKLLNPILKINIIGITNLNIATGGENLLLLEKYIRQYPQLFASWYKSDNDRIEINIHDIGSLSTTNLNTIDFNTYTIFAVQPFELKGFLSIMPRFTYKPDVFWVWEFKSLPAIFQQCEKYFRKIYVPSEFCCEVFKRHLKIPVQKIDIQSRIYEYLDSVPAHKIINPVINSILERVSGKTVYGYCFDLNSSILRKNPLNLVKAFNLLTLTDNNNNNNKALILKYRLPRTPGNKFVNIQEREIYQEFLNEVNKNENIYTIHDELDTLDIYKLYTYFDYYISPHAGEGYGFTIYDNMTLGNRIISPYYSGETEYLDKDDIICLDYVEEEIPGLRQHPVYGQMSDFKGARISVASIVNGIKIAYNSMDNMDNCNKSTLYILGNGPSLKSIDFGYLKDKNTFALNSSYKKFAELDFYPTYFGCFDPKLIECHYERFVDLMNNQNNKIEKFFFLNENCSGKRPFTSSQESNPKYQKIILIPPREEYYTPSTFERFYKMNNSGATAALIGILLGYKNIILLGCDGNYVEIIPEAEVIDSINKTLKIYKTPEKNPNYWFDNYQEEGEIYSLPDGNSCHMKGWKLLEQASKYHNVEIINGNFESAIEYFKKEKIFYGKLIYKISVKKIAEIIINNDRYINLQADDTLKIYNDQDKYQIYINNILIQIEDRLEMIKYNNSQDYELAIVIPISLKSRCIETLENFKYIINKYTEILKENKLNIQVCISHTEQEHYYYIDEIVDKYNIDYIFIKNPYNFNLGYTRNLWKYICNSKKILFNDADIPLSKDNLIELIETSYNYDIVKPYDKNLIYTNLEERDQYIQKNIIPKKLPKCLYSITGGVTLFDRQILIETGGYEEFNAHGFEDRCLDIIILNNNYSIKRLDNTIIHLYHPESSVNAINFDSINKKFYNCCINKHCKDNIHEKCNHIKDTREVCNFNKLNNGRLDLFINPFLNSINLKNMEFIKYDKNAYNNIMENNNNDFKVNNQIKDYIITLLGYNIIKNDGSRHTNWFPWNRFKDVYETIGYKCEWTSLDKLERRNEKRIFITWNEPTSLELYQSGKILKDDIIFQKLTSLGKGMNDENWTNNPKKWCEEWHWPIYRTVEYLYDLGLNIYAFGCKTDINLFSEKKRICEKLKDRIHWISWGGTPFNWEEIKKCTPKMDTLVDDINFVGSKWGKIGRGNIDAWEKYIQPFESDNCNYKFNQYGGIGNNMVTDNEMVEILKKSKICPIIHAPSWQAERGIQDRFYTVFLSGRFGICDNLGAIDIFGEEIKEICTEDREEYYKKSIYFLENHEKQIKYIELIQNKIKEKYNFYRQWESVLNNIDLKLNNSNCDLLTNIDYGYLPNKISLNNSYNNENINEYFDKIFIINMEKDKCKKLKILEYLDYINISNYEFISGIDGDILKKSYEYKNIFDNSYNTIWEKYNKKKHISNYNELGCLLSHIKILEIAKERGYKKWLHLEDDVLFDKNLNALFSRNLNKIPKNWDIIYLGCTQAYWRKNNIEYIDNEIYKSNITCGTFAFGVTNNNLDFIINKFKSFKYPADSVIIHEIQNILNCYVIKNSIIIARLIDSSIRTININDEEKLYKKYNWNEENYITKLTNYTITNNYTKNLYNITCNNMTNINKFIDFVKNKKIAIIGPSPSVKNVTNGDFIENNYDIIIRINKQYNFDSNLYKYIGKRTDILYNCMDYREDCGGEIDVENIKDKVKFIVSTIKYDFNNKTHRDSQFHGNSFLNWYYHFHKKNNNIINFIPINEELYDNYDKLADTRINTGLMAIFHILSFDIKELYITGFTFFLDGYLHDYRNIINNSVNIQLLLSLTHDGIGRARSICPDHQHRDETT